MLACNVDNHRQARPISQKSCVIQHASGGLAAINSAISEVIKVTGCTPIWEIRVPTGHLTKKRPHIPQLDRSEVIYRKPEADSFPAVRELARRVFTHTFSDKFDAEPFMEFCEGAFGTEGSMDKDLNDPEIIWRVACVGNELIGYAKLRKLVAPAPSAMENALELQQIYVRPEWHGTGVAAHLMEWAIACCTDLAAPELYLTVFDDNHRAKRFYARNGFSEVGRCDFSLGGQVYDDRIWMKVIERA